MTALEKIAFLRGLADGQGISSETKEGRLLLAIIDALDELGKEFNDLRETTEEIQEGIDEIYEVIDDFENLMLTLDDDDDDDDCCGDKEDCDCDDCCGDDEVVYTTDCPKCGMELSIDEDDLIAGYITCPHCNEKSEFEFEVFDDEDDEDDEDE